MERFKSWLRKARIAQRSIYYKNRFQSCGYGLCILGPTVIVNQGQLIAGDNLTLRSFSYQPIQLRVEKGGELRFGNKVFLNQGVRISSSIFVSIGSNCLIGDEVLILDNDWHSIGESAIKIAPVIIEENVWIAARVTILRGVTIGRNSIIGAGSVVTKPIPANTIAAGTPAKFIREIKEKIINDLS